MTGLTVITNNLTEMTTDFNSIYITGVVCILGLLFYFNEKRKSKNEINELKLLLVEMEKRENDRWNKYILESTNYNKEQKEQKEVMENEIHNLIVEMNIVYDDKIEQEKEEDQLKNEMDIALYNYYTFLTSFSSKYPKIEKQENIQDKINIAKKALEKEYPATCDANSIQCGHPAMMKVPIVLNNKLYIEMTGETRTTGEYYEKMLIPVCGGALQDEKQYQQLVEQDKAQKAQKKRTETKIQKRETLRIKNRDDYLMANRNIVVV